MNYDWISVKEKGLPSDEGLYWVTIKENDSLEVSTLYYLPSDNPDYGENLWFYDEDCTDECTDEIIAYMNEVIPEVYQGE